MSKRSSRLDGTHMHRSSGNVFADAGFPEDEAASLLEQADQAIQAEFDTRARGLMQGKGGIENAHKYPA